MEYMNPDCLFPAKLWHYCTEFGGCAPIEITPRNFRNTVHRVLSSKTRHEMIAVLETAKILNRMMDRNEFAGLPEDAL